MVKVLYLLDLQSLRFSHLRLSKMLTLAAMVTVIGWLGCQVDSILGAVLENRGLMTKGTVNAAAITFGIIAMWWYLGFPHL